nr:hypothetical protein [Hallerella succinigenes]
MNCPIGIRKNLGKRGSLILAILSFVIPLAVWSAVSYIPFIYHPLVQISDAGGSLFCEPGDEIAKENLAAENASLVAAGEKPMTGVRKNPTYLPAPHEVAKALVTAFKTPPKRDGDLWFHESILHSIKIVFLAFSCRALSVCHSVL